MDNKIETKTIRILEERIRCLRIGLTRIVLSKTEDKSQEARDTLARDDMQLEKTAKKQK